MIQFWRGMDMTSKKRLMINTLLVSIIFLTLLSIIVKIEKSYKSYVSNNYLLLVDATLNSTEGIVFTCDEPGSDYGYSYNALNIMTGESVYAYAYCDDGYCSIRTMGNNGSLGSHADNVPVSQLSLSNENYELLVRERVLSRFEYFKRIINYSDDELKKHKYSDELEIDIRSDWIRFLALLLLNISFNVLSTIRKLNEKVLTVIVVTVNVLLSFLVIAGVYIR